MGKHSTGKYAKSKEKKVIVKIIAVIIIMTIIISGVIIYSKINSKEEPERIMNETLIALKELNKEKVNQYLDYDKLISSLDEMILENPDDTELEEELFKNMTWSIEDVDIEDNEATLIIEMTNKDFKTVLTEWMRKIVTEKETQNQITNEIALKDLKEAISDETIEEKTVLKKVKMEKSDEGWEIIVDENLRDLVFPGIDSIISAIEEQS